MNKNEYKVNTYVLIKNGEIYEIDEEGCVKKAKNGENVPFYRKREISEALCKMTKRKSSKFLLVKKDDFIHMEQNGGTEKIFCSLMFPLAKNKPSKWVTFMDDLVTLLPQLNKEYHENLNMISQYDKELTDLMHMIEGSHVNLISYIRYYRKIRKNRCLRRECKTNVELIDQIRNSLNFTFKEINTMKGSLYNAYCPIYNYRTDWIVDQNRLANTLTTHCQ